MKSSESHTNVEGEENKIVKDSFTEASFPAYVFSDNWREFYFFDSDRIFDVEFVPIIKSLILATGAKSATLCDLDGLLVSRDSSCIVFDAFSTAEDYKVLLSGQADIADWWLNRMGRFGCVPDSQNWALYIERNNEIAVIACMNDEVAASIRSAIEKFSPVSMPDAIKNPTFFGMEEAAKSIEWSSKFLNNYRNSISS
jgi:hypothetical protein